MISTQSTASKIKPLATLDGTRPDQKASTQSHSTELDPLDSRLQHISDKIITPSPYLLTLPEKQQQHLSPHQTIDWTRGIPFDSHEGELQYVSFLGREWSDSIVKAVGGWDNDKGELMDSSPNGMQSGKSGTVTPKQGQTMGKKMSLADYKNKKAGGQPGVKETTPTNGTEYDISNSINTGNVLQKEIPTTEAQTVSKRPLSQTLDKRPLGDITVNNDLEPPPKKARLSPPPSNPSKVKTQVRESRKLDLPTLLSPTLPALIEEELAKILAPTAPETIKVAPRMSPSANSSSLIKQTTANPNNKPTSSQEVINSKAELESKENIRDRSVSSASHQTAKVVGNAAHHAQGPMHQTNKSSLNNHPQPKGDSLKTTMPSRVEERKKGNQAMVADTPAQNRQPQVKKRFIVRLKYGKSRRKDVARLLQFSKSEDKPGSVKRKALDSKPPIKLEKDQAQSQMDVHCSTGDKSVTRRNETKSATAEPAKFREKRVRPEDDHDSPAPQSKRQKQPHVLDLANKASTPIPPSFKSPSMTTHGSAQKVNASRRLEITDTDVKTPQGSVRGGTPLAPNSVEKMNRDGRAASDTSSKVSSISGKSDELHAEYSRYSALGRELKHEADGFVKLLSDRNEPRLEKKMIATSIETILCYMLAYTVSDERTRLINVNPWESVLGFTRIVQYRTSGHTLMHGLCLQLEAICRSIILSTEVERLSRLEPQFGPSVDSDTLPVDVVQGAPGNDTVSKAVQPQDPYKEYMKFKAKVAENALRAQQLWTEGAFELSVDDLHEYFPDSWKRKARAPLAKSRVKLVPESLNGDFYLPMSSITTGIEAVRAGWSLLGEWCKKEDVDWAGKLGL